MNCRNLCKTFQAAAPFLSYKTAITERPENSRADSHSMRSVGLYSKFWKNFRTLSVCFLDDLSEDDKQAFKKVIWKWARLTNLNIVFVSSLTATIRIKTNTQENLSAIGTDALLAAPGEPTTWIAEKPGSEFFEATVLHEFGHVLGLQHEHLHPEANIPWNKSKVRDHYAALGWSREEIDRNFFDPVDELRPVLTDYDRQSIMHYPIDKAFTDGLLEVGMNMMFSEEDIRLVRAVYPETPSESPDDPSCRP